MVAEQGKDAPVVSDPREGKAFDSNDAPPELFGWVKRDGAAVRLTRRKKLRLRRGRRLFSAFGHRRGDHVVGSDEYLE
jgi:hypothetical protein